MLCCVRLLASKKKVGKVSGKLKKPDFWSKMAAKSVEESPNLKENMNCAYSLRVNRREFM